MENNEQNLVAPMTLERLHEKIRAARNDRSNRLVFRDEHVFECGVIREDDAIGLRLVTAFINWGVRRKAMIKRIPVLHSIAQRVYWALRRRYFERMDNGK
ncbi:MAG: hypothetical protein OHK006_16670 [Thermodesulfovibrionales bacterium]